MDNKKFNDYDGFVEKFKPKLTTDDCYTPQLVYDAVMRWVMKEYRIPDGTMILRPFKPGGDYQAEEYPDGCVVIDNPPFSILAGIMRWYQKRGVRFFLFGPALTIFSTIRPGDGVTAIAGESITYANGAKVATGFLTNMSPGILMRTAPALTRAIKMADEASRAGKTKTLPKLEWPPNVITAAQLNSMRSAEFEVMVGEAVRISRLDLSDRGIYGGGFLLSDERARERAEAKAKTEKKEKKAMADAKYELSQREKRIIAQLGPVKGEEDECQETVAN